MTDAEAPKSNELYKKWSRSGDVQRFCTIDPFVKAEKLAIDIGYSQDGSLKSHTLVWIDYFQFAVWAQATIQGYVSRLGFSGDKFVHYGGTQKEGQVISRVFTAEKWKEDSSDFKFRATHLEGQVTSTGAFTPIRPNKILSDDSIKITMQELAIISYKLQVAAQKMI